MNAKGKIEGRGIRIWSDGGIYEGFWHSGMQNGRARVIASSGRKYIGEYRDGKKHGNGTYTWPDGS